MAAGTAVLLSSHVLSEVERVADRVAVIRSGRLLMLESMAGLRAKARHTVEVRFGSPPPAGAFAGVPGITGIQLDGALLRCTMQGVVDSLIKALSLGAIASAAAALGIFGLFAGPSRSPWAPATGKPAVAHGVAALAVVATYLINALAQVTSALRPVRPISPYYLVLGNEPRAHGLRLTGAISVLAAVAAITVAGGVLFARRDLN